MQRIFALSIRNSKFPLNWKKANVIPLHKKDLTNVVSNYRPVSLLCVASKVFERIVFKHVFNFFRENFVINNFQSGFQSGRSTVTQLLELYHQFCSAVDCQKEIRVVFLDIRKAFDKVWHKGILHKLSLCGVKGNLLKWFESYLSERKQRVIINGQYSEWASIDAGVPQGSVLGPLLFLIYINDVTAVVNHCKIRLFADDTCLFIEVDDRENTAAQIEQDLENIVKWSDQWLVAFAPEKTKSLTISNKRDAHLNPSINFEGHQIEEVQSHTYLGLLFTQNLSWNPHINNVETKARRKLNMMLPLKFKLNRKTLEIMFTSFVASTMFYGIEIWGGSFDSHLLKLEQIIVDGMRLVTGATARSNIANLYAETSWPTFAERRDYAMLVMLYKIKAGSVPDYLSDILPCENREVIRHNLRSNRNIHIPSHKSETFKRSFIPTAIRLWNGLDIGMRDSLTLSQFKCNLKSQRKVANILFFYGQRWPAVQHGRLRIGCSKLNYDVSFNLHIPNIDPMCSCGDGLEDALHYFMSCAHFADLRLHLREKVEFICNFDINTLLYGSQNLSDVENMLVFDAVHEFILDSKRFE